MYYKINFDDIWIDIFFNFLKIFWFYICQNKYFLVSWYFVWKYEDVGRLRKVVKIVMRLIWSVENYWIICLRKKQLLKIKVICELCNVKV